MSEPRPAPGLPAATPGPAAPRLALVVIARNEARAIRRCLDSARPWVDEMVVLDTGSTDDTVALARACGARVRHFTWVDDFAAARNAALGHTEAQWNLILDADEWIEGGAECLSGDRLGDAPFIGVASVRSTFVSGGAAASATHSISRLLPRGTRYSGRIHEQPQSALPRRKIELLIGHDGYMPAPLLQKRGRNAVLLERALAEEPGNPHLHYHLGKDHEVYERYAQACHHYRCAWEGSLPGERFRHGLITRWMHCMGRIGQTQAAIDLACAQMDQWQHSPDFFFVMGNLLLDLALAHPARAVAELLPLAQSCWERCLEIGDAPGLEDSVAGRGSHLAAHNLAVVRRGLEGGLAACRTPPPGAAGAQRPRRRAPAPRTGTIGPACAAPARRRGKEAR